MEQPSKKKKKTFYFTSIHKIFPNANNLKNNKRA